MRRWIRAWWRRHEVKTIARRLDWLFIHHLKADGTTYTYAEIEAIMAKQSTYRLDAATIERLRYGQIKEPSWLDLRTLGQAFGLTDPGFLCDDQQYTDHDLELASQAAPRGDDPMQQLSEQSAASMRGRLESFIEQGLMERPNNLDLMCMGLGLVDRRLIQEANTVTDEELLALASHRGDELAGMMRMMLEAVVAHDVDEGTQE